MSHLFNALITTLFVMTLAQNTYAGTPPEDLRVPKEVLDKIKIPTQLPVRPTPQKPFNYLENINCRIVEFFPNGEFTPLVDVEELNTLSKNKDDFTFDATLHNKHLLQTSIWNVKVGPQHPGDRFWITMSLDGKPHLKVTRMSMEVWIETFIEGHRYVLHCFPPIALPEEATQ